MATKPTYEELEQRVKELKKEAAERKRAEEALKESEERFRGIIENAPSGYYRVGKNGLWQYVNQEWERMHGYSRQEVIGKHFEITQPEEAVEQARENVRRALSGETITGEFGRCRKDGFTEYHTFNIQPVYQRGKIVAIEGFINDITELKRAEEELKKYQDHLEELVENRTRKLEEVNTELESFAYTVSHDLRAPLRAMQGFSQALLEDYAPKLDAQGEDYALRIDSSARRMETLIQDLLEYSRLSRSEIKLKPVDLTSVVEHVVTQLEAEIKDKNALIRLDKPLPAVLGHSATLEQVVDNLIMNAIKFVPHEVKPHVHLWAEEHDTVVRLWVEDNGIGIAPEHHERIFRIFERLHGIETYPGTGIGLATVKKGLEKMAGTVGVESVSGKGSRFWIELSKKEEQ